MDGAFPSQRGEFDSDSFRGGRGSGGRSGFRGTAENAKTKLCNRWMQGECRFGDRCNFAHGEAELRIGHDQDGQNGGRGYGQRGRGYAFGGRGPVQGGRGYAGSAYVPGGYSVAYQGGYAIDQSLAGFEQRPGGGLQEDQAWAAQGCPVAGPNGWCMYRAKDTGEIYYHNHRTQVTQWEKPNEWI